MRKTNVFLRFTLVCAEMFLRTIGFLLFCFNNIRGSQICKVGHLASSSNFTDENFPSIARIFDQRENKFICNAVIISKNQLLTARSCLEGKRDPREIIIVLREFNQKEKSVNLTATELFFHPSWSPDINDNESNSVIIITKTKIPFNFFIFTTCYREFLLEKGEKISQIVDSSTCEKVDSVPKSIKIFEIPFPKSKSGVLYTQFRERWYLLGFYVEDVIESKVCETKKFKSFDDLYNVLNCNLSKTTVVGTKSSEKLCSGEVIFFDDFNTLDNETWRHENTLRGGGNWEFQWYVPDPENSFVKDGILHIKPTFTDDKFGKNYVTTKTAHIPPLLCTDREDYGCLRSSKYGTINPIRSASVSTINSIAFKYGTVEIRAKISAGDWLASSIYLLPKDPAFYGVWPFSGEIDFLESRGNRNLSLNDEYIGVQQVGTSFQFGGIWDVSHGSATNESGFDKDFHIYKLVWSPEELKSFVDDTLIHHIVFKEDGLWNEYNLGAPERNPWKKASLSAPFDHEFYISIHLKAGGVKFFPDDAINYPLDKPWSDISGHAATDFWKRKKDWEGTWKENDVDFQIDYVKITAL